MLKPRNASVKAKCLFPANVERKVSPYVVDEPGGKDNEHVNFWL